MPSGCVEFYEGLKPTHGYAGPLDKVNAKKFRSHSCGSGIFKRLDYSAKTIHNDPLPNDSSRIRDFVVIPGVGEQGSQYSKKVAESRP